MRVLVTSIGTGARGENPSACKIRQVSSLSAFRLKGESDVVFAVTILFNPRKELSKSRTNRIMVVK
jgi:hypothetical protein